MAEQIGLMAIMNLTAWSKGVKTYTGDIATMNTKTGAVAASISKQFVGIGNSIGSALGNVAKIATGVALAGVVTLGAGIVAAMGGGISKAIDLDQQMANVAATMGATKETAGTLKAELKDLAFDLSLDPNLTVNLEQAGQALEVLAANGAITTDEFGHITQASKDLTVQTVALANATGSDFATAAAIATDASNLFGLKANELGKAVDGAAGVMNASKFDATDYALALAQAGGVAGAMGISIEDFNAVIAGTASSFNSGSDAGTSFKTLLQRLANPTAKMKDLMEQYGISLFDADGNMRDMSNVAGQLHNAFSGLTDAKRAEIAATLGGADASRILLGLASMTSDEFVTLSEQVNRTGQGLEAAATRVDTVSGAWQIFLGILEAIQVQIGTAFLPLIKDMLVSFARLANRSGPLVIGFFNDVVASITKVTGAFQRFGARGGTVSILGLMGLEPSQIAGVMASVDKVTGAIDKIGGALQRFGARGAAVSILGLLGLSPETIGVVMTTVNQIITIITGLVTQVSSIMSGLTFQEIIGGLTGIGTVLATGVFVAIVAGLLSLLTPVNLIIAGAALLGAAWAGNWGGIRDTTLSIVGEIQSAFERFMSAFEAFGARGALFNLLGLLGLSSDTMVQITTAWATIQAVFLTGQQVVLAVFAGMTAALQPVGVAFNDLGVFFTGLGITWGDVGNALLTATKLVFAGIAAAIVLAVSVVTSFAAGIAAMVSSGIASIQFLLQGFERFAAGVGQIITGIIAVFQGDFLGGLQALNEGAINILGGLGQVLLTVFTAPLTGIISFLGGFGSSMIAFWQGLYDTLVGNSIIPDLVNDIVAWFTALPEKIMSVLSGLTGLVSGIFEGLFSGGEGEGGFDLTGLITSLLSIGPAVDQVSEALASIGAVAIPALIAQTTGFSEGFVIQLTGIFTLITQINTLLLVIANVTFPLLLAQSIITTAGMITQFTQVITTVTRLDTLLLTVANVTMPLLLVQSLTTTTGMIAGFTGVVAIVTTLLNLFTQILKQLEELEKLAKTVGEKITDAFKDVADATERATQVVGELVKAYERMEAAATRAASAARSAASSASSGNVGASSGLGFSSGVGFAGGTLGWTVPAGYNSDNFMVGLTSGEEVIVAPRNQSIEEIVTRRFADRGSGAGSTTVVQPQVNIPGPIYINSEMDMRTFEARVTRAAVKGLGGP